MITQSPAFLCSLQKQCHLPSIILLCTTLRFSVYISSSFFFPHTFLSHLLAFHSPFSFLYPSSFSFSILPDTAACKPLYTPNTMLKLFIATYQQNPSFPNGHVDDDAEWKAKRSEPWSRVLTFYMSYPAAGIIVMIMMGEKVTSSRCALRIPVTLWRCFSTSERPRSGKFFFHKTRARSQQIYT